MHLTESVVFTSQKINQFLGLIVHANDTWFFREIMEHGWLTANSSVTLQEVTNNFAMFSFSIRVVVKKNKLFSLLSSIFKSDFNLRVLKALTDFRSGHPYSSVEAFSES
jgi:hypothetical protein